MNQRAIISTLCILIALLVACATRKDPYATPAATPLSKRKFTVTAFTNSPPSAPVTPGAPAELPVSPPSQNTASAPPTAPTTPSPKVRVLPFNARIASVNEKLRYVIIDFTNSRQPAIDERLSVYRVGEKVAEIKISGPYRNATVAADIVAGEVKYGDEVKMD